MSGFMPKACKHCPFRRDVTPFLHPERAEGLAFQASNRYGTFPCHKTTEHDDETDSGEMFAVETSKECAGHLTMQFHANERTSYCEDGFKPDPNCYEEPYEMIEAYEEEWESERVA